MKCLYCGNIEGDPNNLNYCSTECAEAQKIKEKYLKKTIVKKEENKGNLNLNVLQVEWEKEKKND